MILAVDYLIKITGVFLMNGDRGDPRDVHVDRSEQKEGFAASKKRSSLGNTYSHKSAGPFG